MVLHLWLPVAGTTLGHRPAITVLARATVDTILLRLLNVAASITVSVRRIHVGMVGVFPLQEGFATARSRLIN